MVFLFVISPLISAKWRLPHDLWTVLPVYWYSELLKQNKNIFLNMKSLGLGLCSLFCTIAKQYWLCICNINCASCFSLTKRLSRCIHFKWKNLMWLGTMCCIWSEAFCLICSCLRQVRKLLIPSFHSWCAKIV